eukprot:TRINITY_DN107317_c0_g1_i1.p1 TRINITY_DN107317_c0_g1~~TRINITY_DN107317_c0_g1_i1.p1  ORF type:complete len:352 (-),score=52.17 TRINITY_DN107317_c0_g1_i1:149-1204(-)
MSLVRSLKPPTPTIKAAPLERNAAYFDQKAVPPPSKQLGEDDDLLRKRGDTPVVWWKGHAFQVHPSRRLERDEGIAALERNAHGVPEEWWKKQLAEEALRDFHRNGVDEHLERLRAAWIDTPPEGQPPIQAGSVERTVSAPKLGSCPEPWAAYSTAWTGSRQALAHERLDTLENLRRRVVHGTPWLYALRGNELPFAVGSRPATPPFTPEAHMGATSYKLVPVRNDHGRIIEYRPGPEPSLAFTSPEVRRSPDQWDQWQHQWGRDQRRLELSGWQGVALQPSTPMTRRLQRQTVPEVWTLPDRGVGKSTRSPPSTAASSASSSTSAKSSSSRNSRPTSSPAGTQREKKRQK